MGSSGLCRAHARENGAGAPRGADCTARQRRGIGRRCAHRRGLWPPFQARTDDLRRDRSVESCLANGANLATHLTTSRPLAFGDVVIPAGQFTLWTLPTAERWTLIISRQTTQWGTDYDATHDLARIPMRLRTLAEPVEQFTIAVEPRRGGGVLRMIWDTTEASANFALRDK